MNNPTFANIIINSIFLILIDANYIFSNRENEITNYLALFWLIITIAIILISIYVSVLKKMEINLSRYNGVGFMAFIICIINTAVCPTIIGAIYIQPEFNYINFVVFFWNLFSIISVFMIIFSDDLLDKENETPA